MEEQDKEKKIAARAAVEYVRDGMVLGVGSGSTVAYFIEELAQKVKEGIRVTVVPTSLSTKEKCEAAGISCMSQDYVPTQIDLTVDGADEFDTQLNLIKGGGGCLLWEKIVAAASDCEIIIVDSTKKTNSLGSGFKLPIEVIPYAVKLVMEKLEAMGIKSDVRKNNDGTLFFTDQRNYILDCITGNINNVQHMADQLSKITGVVEHGLFVGMTDMVLEGNGEYVKKYVSVSPVVTKKRQTDTMLRIEQKIGDYRAKGIVPVIELDLDLTTFVPDSRTVYGLQKAGEKYNIKEFVNPSFELLPGYTREAWTNFLSRNRLPEKYPSVRWMGEKDGKDGESVYSSFHKAFWSTDMLQYDTLTAGLKEFIEKMQKLGAVVVFVSGRWLPEQIKPTKEVLKSGGLQDVPLLIGNPRHDGANPVSDSEVKALHQSEIREKYGMPAVVIDDRKENRDAICEANPDSDMLSIGCSIPGYTYDEEIMGIEWKISDFWTV